MTSLNVEVHSRHGDWGDGRQIKEQHAGQIILSDGTRLTLAKDLTWERIAPKNSSRSPTGVTVVAGW